MRQLPLPVQLRASSVFASYYAGDNIELVNHLKALAPGSRQPVDWIYGPPGVGKTHLLQAICAQAGERNLSALYLPLADSTVKPEILAGCESLAYVCLDDFEQIAADSAWERSIFRLHTEFEDSGGRLLIAANSTPANITIELKDLASRLAIGRIFKVHALDDSDQAAALMLRASQLGLELPGDVAQFLLRRLPRDMASLCDALDRLDRASLATQRKLSVPFVRKTLEELFVH